MKLRLSGPVTGLATELGQNCESFSVWEYGGPRKEKTGRPKSSGAACYTGEVEEGGTIAAALASCQPPLYSHLNTLEFRIRGSRPATIKRCGVVALQAQQQLQQIGGLLCRDFQE